jgi:alkanesulfonate monooxygenase SsuD/methylene tetrahydromethanopterin reductase-like flavin-dependent oxidoreductase (luciferase family)
MISDTTEEAKLAWDNLPDGQKLWAIYGTEDEIVSQIEELKNEGITDIMICNEGDYFFKRHLSLVKRMTGGENGVI